MSIFTFDDETKRKLEKVDYDSAMKLLNTYRNTNSVKHVFQEVDCRKYLHLSMRFYDSTQKQLESLGFERVVDFEDVTLRTNIPNPRTFIRMFVNREKNVCAGIYHVKPIFPWNLVLPLMGIKSKVIDFVTTYPNGATIETTNLPSKIENSNPEIIKKYFRPGSSLTELLDFHLENVSTYGFTNIETICVDSLDKFVDYQRMQYKATLTHLERVGWITIDYLYKLVGKNKSQVNRIYKQIQVILHEEKGLGVLHTEEEILDAAFELGHKAVLVSGHLEAKTLLYKQFSNKEPDKIDLLYDNALKLVENCYEVANNCRNKEMTDAIALEFLAKKYPGFSPSTYQKALNWGYFISR
jgi:hypothetical protein